MIGNSNQGAFGRALESFVFGNRMLVLALRFLLRALLALSGHIEVDPDAAHKEEIGQHHAAAVTEKGSA